MKSFLLTVLSLIGSSAAFAEIVIVSSESSLTANLNAAISSGSCCNELSRENIFRIERSEPAARSYAGRLNANVRAAALGRVETAASVGRIDTRVTATSNWLEVRSDAQVAVTRSLSDVQNNFSGSAAAQAGAGYRLNFTISEPMLFFFAVQLSGISETFQLPSASLIRNSTCGTGGCTPSQTVLMTQSGLTATGLLAAGTYSLALDAQAVLESFRRTLTTGTAAFSMVFRATPVPLPAGVWLMLSAIGALTVVRRSPRKVTEG